MLLGLVSVRVVLYALIDWAFKETVKGFKPSNRSLLLKRLDLEPAAFSGYFE